MPEADFSMTDMAMVNGGLAERQKERLLIQFSMFPVQDQAASAAEGRPIFVDKEYIKIIVPGDKNNVVHRPVWEDDKRRFPDAYRQFKEKGTNYVTGTPLKLMTWITAPQVEEMAYFHVSTVEQLAALSDEVGQKFRGINALRQLARDYVAAAKESAPLTALRAEIEKKDEELAAANQAIAEQGERMKALEAKVEKMLLAEA